MAAPKEHVTLDLNTLNPAELEDLKSTVDTELQNLSQGILTLQKAAAEFGSAERSIAKLSEQSAGQELLMPLTGSLYVRGTLEDIDNVLINVGTGYYVEMSAEDGIGYCQRKVAMVKKQIGAIGDTIKTRQVIHDQVNNVLRRKLAQQSQSAVLQKPSS